MNSMPLGSSAARIFLILPSSSSPSVDLSLAIVGFEMHECRARSDWDQVQCRSVLLGRDTVRVENPIRQNNNNLNGGQGLILRPQAFRSTCFVI